MNLDALAVEIHQEAEILRAYKATGGNVASTARACKVSEYRVMQVCEPEKVEAAKARVATARIPPEWGDCVCEVCKTQQGRMYCAMCCDGEHCDEHATKALLDEYEAYTAARRRNNRLAAREERKYRPRRSEGNVNEERRSVG